MQALLSFLKSQSKTLLCAGPLSTNIVDVAIELSNLHQIPLILVASRRQIESAELGSGYVNNWSTDQFINYVRARDSRHVFLERDHGGPGQGYYELKNDLSVDDCMVAAKKSYEKDIDAGMQILHIDPTIPIRGESLSYETVLQRLFELYGHVSEYAARKGADILIEIGTEEQNGSFTDIKQFENFLQETEKFCIAEKFKTPTFAVIQTGAKVMETRNTGLFERGSKFDKINLTNNIRESAAIAQRFGVFIKEHNADYLSYDNLTMRPTMGISASNIAPEFGWIESANFFKYLNYFGLGRDYENAIDLVIKSKKWDKWMLPDTSMKNYDKACLAAHYCYSAPAFIEIKARLASEMNKKNLDLDMLLRQSIKAAFYKYLTAFRSV